MLLKIIYRYEQFSLELLLTLLLLLTVDVLSHHMKSNDLSLHQNFQRLIYQSLGTENYNSAWHLWVFCFVLFTNCPFGKHRDTVIALFI